MMMRILATLLSRPKGPLSQNRRTRCRPLNIETLESRQLLAGVQLSLDDGVLTITGTPQPDQITVYKHGNYFRFRDGFSARSTSTFVPIRDIELIRFFGGHGDDRFVHQHRDPARTMLPRVELYGGPGRDRLFGGPEADVIRGGEGNDFIIGFGAHDALFGGDGSDIVAGGEGDDVLVGGPGRDKLRGGNGDDLICGGAGADRVLGGGNGNDRIYGGGQSGDRFSPGHGDDLVFRFACDSRPLTGDWNGDGVDDLGTYFPRESAFVLSGAARPYFRFGPSYSEPLLGNWDGRPGDEVGVFFANHGLGYYMLDSGVSGPSGESWHQFGFSDDQPLVGDWDGDGADEFGVFRSNAPGGPRYYLDQDAPGWTGRHVDEWGHQFGLPGDTPFVGDWNGDGIDEFGVFSPHAIGGPRYFLDEFIVGGGTAYARGWTGQIVSERFGYAFGFSTDTPVIGDWNGDGIDDFGVFRTLGGPGYFFIDEGPRGYQQATFGETYGYRYGRAGDVPLIGDWDGDGDSDFGLYRGSLDAIARDYGIRGWQGGVLEVLV